MDKYLMKKLKKVMYGMMHDKDAITKAKKDDELEETEEMEDDPLEEMEAELEGGKKGSIVRARGEKGEETARG